MLREVHEAEAASHDRPQLHGGHQLKRLACSYVLPIKADRVDGDLIDYLRHLSGEVSDLVVVDGSDAEVFEQHRCRLPMAVRHLRPDPDQRSAMGKVAGVLTGLDSAHYDVVVIADDDVRWTTDLLRAALERVDTCEVLRPQNVFVPSPWHARWDTGRILLNRVTGGDWPGTLVVRRSALAGGYSGDALFENLELVRTVRARGGRERVALDLCVPRRPPATPVFWRQRVRQAYDEWARPGRLLIQLAVLPAILTGGLPVAGCVGMVAVVLAELGRRRGGGRRFWSAGAALWAPVWVAERSVTSWMAVGARFRGGARYRGTRLPTAAHSTRWIRGTLGSSQD